MFVIFVRFGNFRENRVSTARVRYFEKSLDIILFFKNEVGGGARTRMELEKKISMITSKRERKRVLEKRKERKNKRRRRREKEESLL